MNINKYNKYIIINIIYIYNNKYNIQRIINEISESKRFTKLIEQGNNFARAINIFIRIYVGKSMQGIEGHSPSRKTTISINCG